MATDIGESLVGSYLRYVVGCEVVVYNTHTPGVQGEIDVIGLQYGEPRSVWLCEVITHLQGTQYGTYDYTIGKIRDKIARARAFADQAFPGDKHLYEIWTPIAPKGIITRFEQLAAAYVSDELDVRSSLTTATPSGCNAFSITRRLGRRRRASLPTGCFRSSLIFAAALTCSTELPLPAHRAEHAGQVPQRRRLARVLANAPTRGTRSPWLRACLPSTRLSSVAA